jgi:hypothetical protein
MKQVIIVGALVAAAVTLGSTQGQAQGRAGSQASGTALGSVTLNRSVMADGKPLAAGTYQVRLTNESPKPGVGQTPDSERYVEFVRSGKVAGREVATVVSQAEVGEIAKGPRPRTGGARVELLKGDDYVRVWINRGGMNYIIHMPPAAS